jgi:hypothetical protein
MNSLQYTNILRRLKIAQRHITKAAVTLYSQLRFVI